MDEVASVPVPLTDLEDIKSTLMTTMNYHECVDIAENYRKLNNRQQKSALTRAIDEAIAIVDTHIVEAQSASRQD